jgi:chaperone required for assembly of F1-ATPase
MQRPDAPYDLTDEQAEEWRAIVNRMPPIGSA